MKLGREHGDRENLGKVGRGKHDQNVLYKKLIKKNIDV